MARGINVFTTGEVAEIICVVSRTVSKMFDNGKLEGYKIPGSKDRRITQGDLTVFLFENEMSCQLPNMIALQVNKIVILKEKETNQDADTRKEEVLAMLKNMLDGIKNGALIEGLGVKSKSKKVNITPETRASFIELLEEVDNDKATVVKEHFADNLQMAS